MQAVKGESWNRGGEKNECKSWWTELLKLNKWKHSEPWEVRCLETTKIGAPGVQISLGATMNKTWSALSLALFLLSLSLCSFLSVSVSIHWALLAWQITLYLDCHSGSRQAADNRFNKEQGRINDELCLMKYATSSIMTIITENVLINKMQRIDVFGYVLFLR